MVRATCRTYKRPAVTLTPSVLRDNPQEARPVCLPVVYDDVTAAAPRFPFYFRQVLAGPHKNFHYVIGDPQQDDAAVVDPAFGLERLFDVVRADGKRIRDALFTHGHWDHIGGADQVPALGVERVHIHEAAGDHEKVQAAASAGAAVVLHSDGDMLRIGDLPVQWLHTPGHQPEASCFIVGQEPPQALLGGDTLFVGSCGRTDFPGGDTDAMFASMARLRDVAHAGVHLMPGHHYGDVPHRRLIDEIVSNPALATVERDAFGSLHCLSH